MTRALISPKEVAEMIGLSVRTVQDMMRRKELPSCQVSPRRRMVPSGALDEWIKQNTDWPDPSSTGRPQRHGMSSGDREGANVAALRDRSKDTMPNDG